MYETVKRIMDIVVAAAVFLVFLPLIVIISVAIPLDSPGPVIFKQRRVGQNGKLFDMWKFRSMYDKVDEKLKDNPEFIKQFKKKEGWKFSDASRDPRITRVGRFIRKFSLDELPNLWNIFTGEMSMVGPRAYRNDDVFGDEIAQMIKIYPHLKDKLNLALSVKPGITGPWQTSGRNKLPFDKRVELDAAYARQKSLWQDLIIILKTPFAMLNKW
jgi:lipopolysaccharide/colanic/teichoic acid biosynthesis glycosyltransferase